jgi:hypothetical protein
MFLYNSAICQSPQSVCKTVDMLGSFETHHNLREVSGSVDFSSPPVLQHYSK